MYASDCAGWYPRGGKDEWDSLAKSVRNETDARCSTSHRLGAAAVRYWQSNRTLSAEVCCYRYNEGLHTDDLGGHIVMYYNEPTRWECNMHRTGKTGRPVLTGWCWEFLEEAEFQERQVETRRFIAARKTAEHRPPASR